MQSLKKGDIVFSKNQTEQLVKYGKINGHGKTVGMRAHADGTAHNMLSLTPAHAISASGGFDLDKNPKKSSSTSSNVNSAANAVKDAAKDTKKNNKKNSKNNKSTTKKIDKIINKLNKYYDWIAVRVERLTEKIDLNESKSQNAKGYSAKNNLLNQNTDTTKKLISDSEAGLKKYKKHAEKVRKELGLSEKIAKKVREGTIDIQKLSNKTKKKVDAYKTAWDKVTSKQKDIEDLRQSLVDLANTKFDNITDEFETFIAAMDHGINSINNMISRSEEQGYITSRKYYDALNQQNQSKISKLVNEKAALESQLAASVADGTLEVGDLNWQKLKNQIDSVDESIQSAQLDTDKWNNSIRQLEWDQFDRIQEAISAINEEAEFYINLMGRGDKLFDDKGNITDKGLATQGLYAQEYDTYRRLAKNYSDEIDKLNKQIEENPYDTNLINERDERIKQFREATQSAEDVIDRIQDTFKTGIEKQISALNKLIDRYEKALDSQKDLDTYRDNIQDKQKEISNLEKQLSVRRNDTSESGKAKTSKLQDDLAKARKELAEAQEDHTIDEIKDALSQLSEDYEEALNDRADDRDALLNTIIQQSNNNSSTIEKTIEDAATSIGTEVSESLSSVWSSMEPLTTYLNNIFANENAGILEAINNVTAAVNNLKVGGDIKADQDLGSNTGNGGGTNTNGGTNADDGDDVNRSLVDENTKNKVKTIINSGKKHKKSVSKKEKNSNSDLWEYVVKKYGRSIDSKQEKQIAQLLGVGVPPKQISKDGKKAWRNSILEALKLNGFASGARRIQEDQNAWIGENNHEYIVRKSDGAILQKLNRGDSVLNAEQVDNIYNMSKNPAEFIKSMMGTMPDITAQGNNVNMTINNTFDLKNVTNPQEFMNYMKTSKAFEKMIQDMTLNKISGSSNRLAKYNNF